MESLSIQDQTLPPAVAGASPNGNVQLSDLMAMDFKTIYNKSVYHFVAQWAMYYFNLDEQIFNPGDTDMMVAAKATAVSIAVDIAGASLRRQFPALIM
jgi:hypothetical protein